MDCEASKVEVERLGVVEHTSLRVPYWKPGGRLFLMEVFLLRDSLARAG